MERVLKIVIKILLAPVFLVVLVCGLLNEVFEKCSDLADECIEKLFDLIEEAGNELAEDFGNLFLKFFEKDADYAESPNEMQSDVNQTAD